MYKSVRKHSEGGVVSTPTGYMSPEVKITGFKDNQTQYFFDRIRDLQPVDNDIASRLINIRQNSGKPNVMMFGNQDLRKKYDYINNNYYNPISNTIHLADDININDNTRRAEQLANSFLDEVPHSRQFANAPFSTVGKWLGNDSIDYLKGNSPYKDNKSVEYDAHSNIEPELKGNFQHQEIRDTHPELFRKLDSLQNNSMYKNIKKYADGGDFFSNNQNAIVAGGNFLGSTVDSFNNQQNPDAAMSGFSGALKGAAAGTAVLPGIGTAVGAGLGLLTGVVGAIGKHNAYMKAQQARWKQTADNAQAYSNVTLRQYDTNGVTDAKLYDDGGPILNNDNGIPISRIKLPKTSIDFNKLQIKRLDPILGNPEYFGASNGTQIIPNGSITSLRASSDKLNGTSNQYYSPVNQARGKAIETVHTNGYFRRGGKVDPNVELPNFPLYDDGGQLGQPYEVEQGETVQGNPILEDSTQLASDMHEVNGERHEDGGTMGSGGERVFSDRLKISDNLKDILKTNGISIPKKSTYADVSNKIGKLKGKLEDKKDSAGKNSAQLMIPRLDQALDDTFNDQEMGKGYNKSMNKFAGGGRLPLIYGTSSSPSDIDINTDMPQESIDNMTLAHNYTPDVRLGVLSSVGDFLKNNTGQVANAANYLSNMASINGLDTKVQRSYVPVPQYNYTDRSGYAYNRNNSALNTGIRSLSGTGRTVNASNIGQLYAKTLDGNSNIALNEAARKDAYNENYNQRLDRVNTINSQIQNEASDQQRSINNEKIGLQLGAKNALLTGIQGNIASKKAEDFQNKQLLTILAGNDQNGVMTRFLKNYPTYKKLLKTYNSTTE